MVFLWIQGSGNGLKIIMVPNFFYKSSYLLGEKRSLHLSNLDKLDQTSSDQTSKVILNINLTSIVLSPRIPE